MENRGNGGLTGRLSRRELLRLGVGAAGVAAFGALLSACGQQQGGQNPASSGGQAVGGTAAPAKHAGEVIFISSQFKPVEEAE